MQIGQTAIGLKNKSIYLEMRINWNTNILAFNIEIAVIAGAYRAEGNRVNE